VELETALSARATDAKTDHRPECRPVRFAALDLGTNNCRMIVAEPTAHGFFVVDGFSRIVRLGEGLARTGRLDRRAVERTLDALRVCAGKLRQHRLGGARLVATEACRRADDGGRFVARVADEIGMAIEVIGPDEEAMLALAGCVDLLNPRVPFALMFDIGGGSTEITWVAVPHAGPPAILGGLSLGVGVVTLAERFAGVESTPSAHAAMRALIADDLDAFDRAHGVSERIAAGRVQMVGASGTVTTLTAVVLGLHRYERARVDGRRMPADRLARAVADLVAMDDRARDQIACIGRGKRDLMMAGCAILGAILARWPVPIIAVADRGVREGILNDLMGRPKPSTDGAVWSRGRF
jgi:exopolyphosphatase/guanosine-5'-triphosphate,3'-diphosphate pyrophosphatase